MTPYPLPPQNGSSDARAATGHTEQEVLAQIAQAAQAGQAIRYVVVRTSKRDYTFPPQAQIVRTDNLLVVRAYKRLYAWQLDGISLHYSGAATALDLSSLPLVKAPVLDTKARAVRSGSTLSTSAQAVCSDCALVLWRAATPVFPDPWSKLRDPWQVHPDWSSPGRVTDSTRHTRFTEYGSGCDQGWTCYYGWYGGYNPGDGGGGGGGGGGGTGPAPAPNPPCHGTSSTDANARDAAAGNAFKAANQATPQVFNDIGSDANAPYGKEAHGYIYSDGLGNFSWDSDPVTNLNAQGQTTLPADNPPAGWTTVGQWHTHPHQPPPADPTQTENGLHFSPTDINTAASSNWIMYVGVLDTLSNNSAENPQERWYRYDPNAKSETLKNTVGAGGC